MTVPPLLERGVATLTIGEFVVAAHHAVDTWGYAQANGYTHRRMPPGGAWLGALRTGTIGYSGEILMARLTGKPWIPTLGPGKAGDLAGGHEIRTTVRTDAPLMILDGNDLDRWYTLVVGDPPHLTPVGCIWGREAETIGTHRDGALWVPQSALRPWGGP